MTQRLMEWQKRGLIALENVVGINSEFEKDISYLRIHKNEPVELDGFNILGLIQKYNLPMGTLNCLEGYINTSTIDPTLIESSIIIVSDKRQTAEPSHIDKRLKWFAYSELSKSQDNLKLVIPPETTQAELIAFIKRYRLDIERNLDDLSLTTRKRIRARPKEKRNQDIINWHKEGLTNSAIAQKANEDYPDDPTALTSADIRTILSRKNQNDTKRNT